MLSNELINSVYLKKNLVRTQTEKKKSYKNNVINDIK